MTTVFSCVGMENKKAFYMADQKQPASVNSTNTTTESIRNALSALTFFFADADPGDGGFVCILGNHKSNFLQTCQPMCES